MTPGEWQEGRGETLRRWRRQAREGRYPERGLGLGTWGQRSEEVVSLGEMLKSVCDTGVMKGLGDTKEGLSSYGQ